MQITSNSKEKSKVNIFLTIDTEVWWAYDTPLKNLNSAIYGITEDGSFGLPFQLATFNKYNLKANFFVEPFFSLCFGKSVLKQIVSLINSFNQDIQLHIHTEWLSRCRNNVFNSKKIIPNIKDFSKEEQTILVSKALRLLKEAGALNINSFRAGNYGANSDTLDALNNNGIKIDTTYNYTYLNDLCEINLPHKLLQPQKIKNIFEFPITCFSDMPNHNRHLQLAACSITEIEHILIQAWMKQYHSIVIVLHSFEWIKKFINNGTNNKVDRITLTRFHKLCKFLSENRDKFTTSKFSEINFENVLLNPDVEELHSTLVLTFKRYIEQLLKRIY